MAPPLSYQLLDRLLDGKLGERIDQARAEGHSYERIARELCAEQSIDLTGETIRRWHSEAAA